MNVIELGQLYKFKYASQDVNAVEFLKNEKPKFLNKTPTPLRLIKAELANAYKVYVDYKTAREPVLQMLADKGEPFSKDLIESFNILVSQMDRVGVSAQDLFHEISNILGKINKSKNGKDENVRNRIDHMFRGRLNNQTDERERKNIKRKLETVLQRLSSILTNKARELQELTSLEGPAEGGPVAPQRSELSKGKLLWFMRTPAAQHYGLDDLDVMTQLLQDPPIRQKLTTLINAIDRGHIPADGPEVMELASEMKHWLDNQIATNKPSLDLPPPNDKENIMFDQLPQLKKDNQFV